MPTNSTGYDRQLDMQSSCNATALACEETRDQKHDGRQEPGRTEPSHTELSRARLNKGLLEPANAGAASVQILSVSRQGIRTAPMDVGMPDSTHDFSGTRGVPVR